MKMLMFTPIDKFNVESLYNSKASIEVANKDRIEKGLKPLDSSNYGENELDYLWIVTNKYCPNIDVDENGKANIIDNTAPLFFADRYNERKLTPQNKVYNYQKNKDIQECLITLGLDSEKFWYLLLFVYDYCDDKFNNNWFKTKGTVRELIGKFQDTIISNAHFSSQMINFNAPVELTLKIGKNKLHLTDSDVIGMIGLLCQYGYEQYKDNQIFNHCCLAKDSEVYTDGNKSYMFCKMLLFFFDSTKQIKEGRIERAKTSGKEKELLSYLVYFLDLNKNPKLLEPILDEYNTIKWIMNEKNKPRINSMGKWYE